MSHTVSMKATVKRAAYSFASDNRGNVLAMSAAAIFPLMAMVGGAIDLSRFYMTQTRLQQACDAGALAGRKAMSDVNLLSVSEKETAQKYFAFNFPYRTYGVEDRSAAYSRGAVGVVTGVATAVVPTTIMKIFGYQQITLNVTCQSTLVIPNTDVMFVLDVTGSMSAIPTGDLVSKLDGLKQAVKDFYAALGPGTSSGPGRVRYGFMPYSSNVNVGKLLYGINRGYLVGGTGSEQWDYQSRKANYTIQRVATYGQESAPANATSSDTTIVWGAYSDSGSVGSSPSAVSGSSQSNCNTKSLPAPTVTANTTTSNTPSGAAVYPSTQVTKNYATSTPKIRTEYRYLFVNRFLLSDYCQLQQRSGTYSTNATWTTTTPVSWSDVQQFSSWSYEKVAIDVSAVVQNGTAGNPTYWAGTNAGNDPNLNEGRDQYGNYYTTATPSTITWGGCIEEASTTNSITASSSLDVPSDADDLKIDLIPSSTATRWKPFLPAVQFARNRDWLGRGDGWINMGFAVCPREASPLTQYVTDYTALTKSSASFNTYVNSLAALGGTYHDIGLIWGARFLSPDGIYRATNSDTTAPGGFQISRHIVFMTDGELDTRTYGNDPWGIVQLDARVAPATTDDATLNEIHKRRTSIICNAMKGKGFTVWVVGFGIATMPQELQDCATDSAHWSLSSNSTQLRARFQQIAQTIGGLRLSQ
jgi:Flp pilus assembly protein TadG